MDMKLKGDQSTTRALNRRLLLNLLRREGEISRAALSARTGLSPAAVTSVVAELIGEEIIVEGDAAKSSGGRKPIPVRINYASRYSIGLKLMHRRIEATLTDLATAVIRSGSIVFSDDHPTTVADAAAAAVDTLLPDGRERAPRLIGVGLAMPGIIDARKGVCVVSQRLGWENVAIAELLANRVHVPVWVENDVKTFAIAQQLFGHGRQRNSVLVLIVGTGVGAGLVFNGQMYRGARFAAGEIGFPDHRTVRLQSRVSWHERLQRASSPGDLGDGGSPGPLGSPRRPRQGDCRRNTRGDRVRPRNSGQEIGRRLAGMIDLVDPEVVIIGGELVRFGPTLIMPILEAVKAYSFAAPPPVEVDWENNVWSRGASALATQHFFDFESMQGLIA